MQDADRVDPDAAERELRANYDAIWAEPPDWQVKEARSGEWERRKRRNSRTISPAWPARPASGLNGTERLSLMSRTFCRSRARGPASAVTAVRGAARSAVILTNLM
jgi:hypothetical protein